MKSGWLPAVLLAGLVPAPAHAQGEAAYSAGVNANRELAARLGKIIRRETVVTEAAPAWADTVTALGATGVYDRLTGVPLAALLTADLQAAHRDSVLSVELALPPLPDAPEAGVQAVGAGRWLVPKVAYLRIDHFAGTAASLGAVDAFLRGFSGAKAVIFDLRRAKGPGMGEMTRLFAALYDKPTRLMAIATRQSPLDGPFADFDATALRDAPSPAQGITVREQWVNPVSQRPLRAAHVYVLVSGQTAMAGEHFAAALQASRRGTIVGERTAGRNHAGARFEIGNGLAVVVPVTRIVDPATGHDWDARGLTADISVPAEHALAEALVAEGEPRAKAEALAATVP